MNLKYGILSLFLGGILSSHLLANNLRQISSREGLSNSSVICLFQDSKRFLWMGTFDGLNRYDGRDIHIYKPDINSQNSLSSNVIRNIVETENNYLWISTKWGLNKLSQRDNRIEEYYNEFKDDSHVARDKDGNLYVLGKKGVLSLYNKQRNNFIDLPVNKDIQCVDVNGFFIDSNDTISIVYNGRIERYTVDPGDWENPQITRQADYGHPFPIDCAFYNKDRLLFVDSKGDLYIINAIRTVFIRNILPLIRENGSISSIILNDSDILIGFKTDGLFYLHSQQNYEPERMDINCGVFSLWKDEAQDIVWIGTDGQGVYAWTKDDYTFNSINLTQLPVKKERPVRAIHTDPSGNLWLGTKDNGVIRIKNYSSATDYSPKNVEHFTTQEGLSNNAVFAFVYSRVNNVLWMGSNGPDINYYSYHDKKIHTLTKSTLTRFSYIHSLFESGDSLLWAGSGNSLIKIEIKKRGNDFETTNSRRFTFDIKNDQLFNQIYSLYPENDSIIWIGVRGNGVIRFNSMTGNYRLITFDERGIAPMNDILCILQDTNKTFWFGTSYGLIRFNIYPDGSYDYKNYNENEGLPNNTIHGILENQEGELWLSSNTGIILFDPVKETFRSFNQNTGLKIIEFSDNAYYKDETNAIFFFGGVDGLVRIKSEENQRKPYVPDIYFTKLRIFNQDYNIHNFEKNKAGVPYIELNHKQNFFAVSFVAMDLINGENSRYSYKLENFSDVWMDTPSNEAQFTNIPPGSYTLRVKYNDGITSEKTMQNIRIVILPAWYMSLYAKISYLLLITGSIFGVFLYVKNKYEQKKRKIARQLDEKYKEEMYEGKLRFFTNITHEFCTPLTLIYGPCERILNHEGSDSFIKKYAGMIQSNTERLNSLIQEVIDFRRMETGNKICHIQALNISKLMFEITDSFNELAERNTISFQTLIEPDMVWNTDYGCFTKILNNLVSNAFKYTPVEGQIVVSVKMEDQLLRLSVYNTGKGIRKEDIPLIFNRYTVLDNIKENAVKGLSSRNGLGLAICQSMTELLQGKIEVESEINQYVQFIVSLPSLDVQENESEYQPCPKEEIPAATHNNEQEPEPEEMPVDKGKPYILVIDDNKELLWMIKEMLSGEYAVITASDGEKGLQLLKQSTPDLIITDIMMPNLDGISLTKQLKQNRHTMHIPLVILSAKNTTDEKIEGIESGADAYVSKPFDAHYLKAVIKHLIKNKKSMEEYYNTSASAYDFSKGQLLLKEDKDFLQKATQIIYENIDKIEFLPDDLAGYLQISVRNLYRKFKDLNQLSPKDFIKEQRIAYAAKLLLTTTLTIQEIMYKTGFTNRSHFYKEFSKRYNQTPKEYRAAHKLKDNYLK
ncbi:MAG: response regulator [Tannerella sp.]|jgi:signal transduction histidine kinase/DNA-binding response OmpR family regulator/ligand-binding sensor domain-containing protein|nr:response regulator [Tannerella sp.]